MIWTAFLISTVLWVFLGTFMVLSGRYRAFFENRVYRDSFRSGGLSAWNDGGRLHIRLPKDYDIDPHERYLQVRDTNSEKIDFAIDFIIYLIFRILLCTILIYALMWVSS